AGGAAAAGGGRARRRRRRGRAGRWRASAQGEGVTRAAAEFHPDRLCLEVVIDPGEAVFTAQARSAVPAERHARGDDPVGVDPYGAGPDLGSDPVGSGNVFGPYRPGQPVGGVDGQFHRLVFGGEGVGGQDRAEDLLPDHGRARADGREHGGLDEETADRLVGSSAVGYPRLLFLGGFEVAQHLFVLRPVGDRSHFGLLVVGR